MTDDQLQDTITRAVRQVVATTYRNPSDWFVNWATGGTTTSGISVNQRTALTLSWVYACADIISSDVAKLPLDDITVDANGNQTLNRGSNIQWLLNHQPNRMMTALTFRRTMTFNMLLAGNGYAAIQRNMTGMPISLIPIDPSWVNVITTEDNEVLYEIRRLSKDPFPSSEIIHLMGLSRDGVTGINLVQSARNSFGLGLAEETHGASHFKNGTVPKVVLKTQRMLTEEEADDLTDRWDHRHGGADKTNIPAIAGGGLDIEALPISNEDAQWLESRKFQRSEVATWFTMPEHKINGEPGPYNSRLAANQEYLWTTLGKHLCVWEQECERKLFPEGVRRTGRRQLKHQTARLLTSDPESMGKLAALLVDSELITRNEGRVDYLGRNRSDEPVADLLSSPRTRSDNSAGGEEEGGEDEPMDTMAAHRAMLADRMSRLISSERTQIADGCKTSDFLGWLDTFYARWTVTVANSLEPYLIACTTLPGVHCELTSTELASRHAEESKRQLLEVAGYSFADNLVSNVTDMTAQWDIRTSDLVDTVLGVVE